jgi:hypothetical protein
MHVSTTGRVVFTAKNSILEEVADYLENAQCGESFFDDEEDSLILTLEDNLDLDGKDSIVRFVSDIYNEFKNKLNIHMIGTMNAIDGNGRQKFECQCNKNYLRYRETEWDDALEVDEDLSYEEFEEENYVDIDEDEYDEYIHRAHDGIKDNDYHIYGNWEYVE